MLVFVLKIPTHGYFELVEKQNGLYVNYEWCVAKFFGEIIARVTLNIVQYYQILLSHCKVYFKVTSSSKLYN